ncbi:MAG: STAS domain-containing protein [bacterium]
MVRNVDGGGAIVGVTTRERDGVLIIDLEGKLMGGADSDSLREEFKRIADRGIKKVIINLEGVPWMNSSGLGVLLAAFIQIRKSGGEMRFLNTQERVRSILTTTKLEKMIEAFDNENTALASFRC